LWGRRTGDIYHKVFKPPPTENIAARLIKRSDDTEAKLQKRLDAFRTNLAAVSDHYTAQGAFSQIDGTNGGANGVFTRVLAAISKSRPDLPPAPQGGGPKPAAPAAPAFYARTKRPPC